MSWTNHVSTADQAKIDRDGADVYASLIHQSFWMAFPRVLKSSVDRKYHTHIDLVLAQTASKFNPLHGLREEFNALVDQMVDELGNPGLKTTTQVTARFNQIMSRMRGSVNSRRVPD